MTRKISTYEELRSEKRRLEELLTAQKALIRHDVAAIREELKPVRKVVKVLGKLTSRDRSNYLLTSISDLAVDLVVKKGIMARSGWLSRLIIPYLTKNLSSHFVGGFKDQLMNKLADWLSPHSNPMAEEDLAPEGPSDQPFAAEKKVD